MSNLLILNLARAHAKVYLDKTIAVLLKRVYEPAEGGRRLNLLNNAVIQNVSTLQTSGPLAWTLNSPSVPQTHQVIHANNEKKNQRRVKTREMGGRRGTYNLYGRGLSKPLSPFFLFILEGSMPVGGMKSSGGARLAGCSGGCGAFPAAARAP